MNFRASLLQFCIWATFFLIILSSFGCNKDEQIPQIEGYALQYVEGYKVYVNTGYRDARPTEAEEALRYIALQLSDINLLEIKEGILYELQMVNIFLENAPSDSQNGAYYREQITKGEHYLKYQAIFINHPSSFISSSKSNLPTMLHEMAHAFHNRIIGYNHAQTREAYANAMEVGLYKDLYASKNYKEYFAELTTTFFNKGPYRNPGNRTELEVYDSLGFATLNEVWLP